MAGHDARADYRAIPAVTFTDPQVASVGDTSGDGTVVGERTSVARLSTYERPKRPAFLKVFADPQRRVLVGAVAVGPEAGEWLGQLTLAIRAEVPVDLLLDTIQPYPTFSEAVQFAVKLVVAILDAAWSTGPGADAALLDHGADLRPGAHRDWCCSLADSVAGRQKRSSRGFCSQWH